jgi:tRNA modification GTPase
LGQLEGRLSAVAEDWRKRLLGILAPLEADIDFPDEGDVPAAVAARAGPEIANLKIALTAFLLDSGRARRIRDGVSIAVVGPPNAGKSSLVNALAGADVAIVSAQPGTTRDVVETRLDLGGVVATVADTAGLRAATEDAIEAEGMARARARAAAADIRVLVLDPSADVPQETFAALLPGDFLVWSKSDLGVSPPRVSIPNGVACMAVSTQNKNGLADLVEGLTKAVSRGTPADEPALTRARHVKAAEDALEALERAEGNIRSAPELAAEDARLAARALGRITGAVGVEDVLGEIFSSFCIGK